MKKKGFTLVELIAVMAITSVVILSVGGLYVTGIKKAQTTKINNDIENTYRNTYQLIKNQIEDSDKVISLKVDNNTKALGKEFKINEKPKELQGLTEDKAYILTKDSNSNIDTILASFRKNDSDELNLYILYMNNTNIDENEIKQNKDILNLKNISRVREVCDNIEKINIDEADNGFNFKLDYLKNNIQRNYEFYISKSNSKMVENFKEGKQVEEPVKEVEPVKNETELNTNIDLLKSNIASLTILNPNKDKKYIIENKGSQIKVEGVPDKSFSFFFPNISKTLFDGDIDKQFWAGVIKNSTNINDKIENECNNNKGNVNFKSFHLKFNNSKVYLNLDRKNIENIKKIKNGDCILISKDTSQEVVQGSNSNFIKQSINKLSKINNLNEINFNNYVGVIIKESNKKFIILTNGDLSIYSEGTLSSKSFEF